MESLANDFAKDLPLVITRFFNIIGPGQRDVFLVPKLIHHYAEKKHIIPLGNMDVSRDFSDVRDVCSAVERLMSLYSGKYRIAKKTNTMSIYNVSNGRATSLREILSLLTELTQHSPEFIVRSDLLRDNEIMSLWGDNRKLIQDVEYQTQYRLQETLRWMLDSYTLDNDTHN
ncbi:NAD-dependent epimerase/dehydratase family protein [Marinomonas algicola]|uniref:NAD-dependent epimerase/dehydratase family protein n=1 Tax=Marinomonas algicola TaxID=2773454 RepID=UPI00174C3037|nr:GDP-mannose 4,6-dehydratase [Marinomonas algicola]